MKLSIKGVEYDYLAALHKSRLADLLELKMASGVGPQAIFAMFGRINKAKTPVEQAAEQEEPDSIRAIMGLIFLCRRRAGEKVTYDEATDVRADEYEFVDDDTDEAEEADPTTASGDQSPPGAETTNGEQPSKPERKRSSSPVT